MLSFAMFAKLRLNGPFTICLLRVGFFLSCLMLCLSSQASNFYVGAAYTPTYFSSWSWNGGNPTDDNSFESWYPLAAQVHVGVEQELFHFQEEDPAWGHANVGVAARLFANVVLTDDRFGGSPLAYGLEPYMYLMPSSQLALKVYVGSGIISDDLVSGSSSFFWGFAFPLTESTELFFDVRSKASNMGIADWSADSSSYNIGVNFKF